MRLLGTRLAAMCRLATARRSALSDFVGNVLTSDPVRYARNVAVLEEEPELGIGAPTVAWADAALRLMKRVRRARLRRPHPPADPAGRGRPRRSRLDAGDRDIRRCICCAGRASHPRRQRSMKSCMEQDRLSRPVLGGVRRLRAGHAALLMALPRELIRKARLLDSRDPVRACIGITLFSNSSAAACTRSSPATTIRLLECLAVLPRGDHAAGAGDERELAATIS